MENKIKNKGKRKMEHSKEVGFTSCEIPQVLPSSSVITINGGLAGPSPLTVNANSWNV